MRKIPKAASSRLKKRLIIKLSSELSVIIRQPTLIKAWWFFTNWLLDFALVNYLRCFAIILCAMSVKMRLTKFRMVPKKTLMYSSACVSYFHTYPYVYPDTIKPVKIAIEMAIDRFMARILPCCSRLISLNSCKSKSSYSWSSLTY